MSKLILRLRNLNTKLGLYNHYITMVLQLPSYLDISPIKDIIIFINSLVKIS